MLERVGDVEEEVEIPVLPGVEVRLMTDKVKMIDKWRSQPIFKTTLTQATNVWQIGFNKDSLTVMYGQVGGKMQTTVIEVVPKVKRNIFQQAWLEAKNLFRKKLRTGYNYEIDSTNMENLEPMLAKKAVLEFDDDGELVKHNLPKEDLLVDYKLDGIRALVSIRDDKVRLRSRQNKDFLFMDHIRKSIKMMFDFLPPGTILDGELFNPKLEFNQITSIVKQKKTPSENEIKMKYYIYDVIESDGLDAEKRKKLLINVYKQAKRKYKDFRHIRIVNGKRMKVRDLKSQLDKAEAAGFEGLMIRFPLLGKSDKDILLSSYRRKRTTSLWKLKSFAEKEAVVIGVKRGKGKNKDKASFVLKDDKGKVFSANAAGDFTVKIEGEEVKIGEDRWREFILANPKKIMGKTVTFKYFEETKDSYRFPTIKAIRDYE